MPSDVSTVRHERRGRVLIVRIEREAKRNAIDRVTAHGIDDALNLLDDDPPPPSRLPPAWRPSPRSMTPPTRPAGTSPPGRSSG
jgi:hypothetical protein